MPRIDGRPADELRRLYIRPGYLRYAEGSVLIELGNTWVICAASVDETVPNFLRGRGQGWVTAEYSMLPRATQKRSLRESVVGRLGGRTQEIQRLIGRSLRAVTDLKALGERTIVVDCDVLQADGGTRTAAITGGYVALALAVKRLVEGKTLAKNPLRGAVAATSVGLVDGEGLLDLAYEEDVRAEVDFNVVMTGTGDLVEVQGTAEGKPFSRAQMNHLLDLAGKGIAELLEAQRQALA
ncbi:MAG: ribonuclease PH [Dehalococcoidales bacterium]|nr:ribonuclease PH [Dehalococcoidales bacterium]